MIIKRELIDELLKDYKTPDDLLGDVTNFHQGKRS